MTKPRIDRQAWLASLENADEPSVEIDAEANAIYVTCAKGRVATSCDAECTVVVDEDKDGNILGMEILGPKNVDGIYDGENVT